MVDQASPWKNPMMKGLEAFKRKHGLLVVGRAAALLMFWQSIIILYKAAKHGLYDYQFYHTATISVLIAVFFYLFLLMADVHKTLNRIKASEEEDNNATLKAILKEV
ncbi:unnamed protein product [Prunus armeniaca]|uniref:Uncharacterized protein n=1 Tax=Prunus armeniaca TaxID=36596 RepID=A0A6J5ULD0_PRUAR|nr:unnamed protein product [Prunus armeniaca]